jgi:predicted nicotinamide N-methyase
MSDYGELKRLAQDAVKGSENWLAAGIMTQLFAAACTPPNILTLIDENERLKQQNEKLQALARRTLWIAYVWNDHNFYAACVEARTEAEKHGIHNFEEANEFLSSLGEVEQP